MRIIIVDDDQKMADLLKTGLQMTFYEKAKTLAKDHQALTKSLEVIKLGDQKAAVDYLVQTGHYCDLIFVEVNTPGFNGFDFIRYCQANLRALFGALIIVTDRAGQAAIKEGLNAGAQDYIVKPFSPDDLKIHVFNIWEKQLG